MLLFASGIIFAMAILIVNNAEPEDVAFNQPLIETVSRLSDYKIAEYREVVLDNTIEGIILSGVPLHYAFETVDDRQPHLAWLKHVTVPVLGICLGHQSIGVHYGQPILQDMEAEDDMVTLQVLRDDPLLQNMNGQMMVRAMHRASIPVPEEFVLLARTERCANQVMKHRDKPIYGMQFHPELSEQTRRLVANFVAIVRSYTGSTMPVA